MIAATIAASSAREMVIPTPLGLRLKVSHAFCCSSGSHVGFCETFTTSILKDFKVRYFFSFSFITQAGQAHVSLVSIASRLLA